VLLRERGAAGSKDQQRKCGKLAKGHSFSSESALGTREMRGGGGSHWWLGARGFAEVLKRMFAVGLLVPTRKQHEEGGGGVGGVARGLTGWPRAAVLTGRRKRSWSSSPRQAAALLAQSGPQEDRAALPFPVPVPGAHFLRARGVINFWSLPVYRKEKEGGVCRCR
jgi:hypothetical protein